MGRLGYWAPVIAGTVVLVAVTVMRRSHRAPQKLHRLWTAMSLLGAGMLIGPLPWALDRGSEALRIAASAVSIVASVSAILLVCYWCAVEMRRHGV
jgi:hypothetical protein